MPRTFVWHPGKGPKRTERLDIATEMVRIKQVRSEIGHPARLRLTLAAIGLKHHQDEIVRRTSPSLLGQLRKVRHLVQVTPVEE